jgi:uncharacterized protein YdeI (YjbR/CyaY-like superfamily)
METFKDLPVLLFASQSDWRAWLEKNHMQSQGLWLKHAKKMSGKTSVSYQEALEEALCYGWVDSQKLSLIRVATASTMALQCTYDYFHCCGKLKAV